MTKQEIIRRKPLSDPNPEVQFKCNVSKDCMIRIGILENHLYGIPHQELVEVLVSLAMNCISKGAAGSYAFEGCTRPAFQLTNGDRLFIGDHNDPTVAWRLSPPPVHDDHYANGTDIVGDKRIASTLRMIASNLVERAEVLEVSDELKSAYDEAKVCIPAGGERGFALFPSGG